MQGAYQLLNPCQFDTDSAVKNTVRPQDTQILAPGKKNCVCISKLCIIRFVKSKEICVKFSKFSRYEDQTVRGFVSLYMIDCQFWICLRQYLIGNALSVDRTIPPPDPNFATAAGFFWNTLYSSIRKYLYFLPFQPAMYSCYYCT